MISGYVVKPNKHRYQVCSASRYQCSYYQKHCSNCLSQCQRQHSKQPDRVRPNKRLQLTPLGGPKIVPILKTDFSSTVIPIYFCGATEAQGVSRHAFNAVSFKVASF